MGTQQILLIVLSVIIVGAAIAVGIQMFNNQSYSASKSAIAADAQSYASQIVQYYKTPLSQGGAGGTLENVDAGKIGSFIGWSGAGTTIDGKSYIIRVAADAVTIYGLGNEVKDGKHPAVQTIVTLASGEINAKVIDTTETTATGLDDSDFPTN